MWIHAYLIIECPKIDGLHARILFDHLNKMGRAVKQFFFIERTILTLLTSCLRVVKIHFNKMKRMKIKTNNILTLYKYGN